ncbi:MAG: hypothetical protein WCV88_02745 [Patescibacteria group bacterium]|jgi:hypothetical protein
MPREPELKRLPPTHTERTPREESGQIQPREVEARSWWKKLIERHVSEASIPGVANGIERSTYVAPNKPEDEAVIIRERILSGKLVGVTQVQFNPKSGSVSEYRRETPQGQPLRVVETNDAGWLDQVYSYQAPGRIALQQYDHEHNVVWDGTITQRDGREVETRQATANTFGQIASGVLADCKSMVIQRVGTRVDGEIIEDIMGFKPNQVKFTDASKGHVNVHRETVIIGGKLRKEKVTESVGSERKRYVTYTKRHESELDRQVDETSGNVMRSYEIKKRYDDRGSMVETRETTETFTASGKLDHKELKFSIGGRDSVAQTNYQYDQNYQLVLIEEIGFDGVTKRYHRAPRGTKIPEEKEHSSESGFILVE